MRSVAVVGSGQAGLLLAHALLRAGDSVTLYSDRTATSWLEHSRPTGTAVRFATSLDWEIELGLDDGHADAPTMEGLRLTVCSHPGRPLFTLSGRFGRSPLAIDLRLQSARWMQKFADRGGHLVLGKVNEQTLDDIAAAHDLCFVATGKGGPQPFVRDEARSPASAPLRQLAMVNCVGPAMRFEGVPFTAAKFTVLDGHGECYWTPYLHMSGKAVWNLVFEAKPGGRFDRFGGCRTGEDVLAMCKAVVAETMPWDASWLQGAKLADVNSWITGAITPTVYDPIGRTRSGHRVYPIGDTYMSFDPLGAQGANMGNRLSREITSALASEGASWREEGWWRAVYDAFYTRYGGPSMAWTQLLLAPMTPGARYLMLAQLGAPGEQVGDTPKQRLADAFVANFDDPVNLGPTLSQFGPARRFVSETMGPAADWEALKGLATVMGRQVQNAVM